MKNKCVSQGSAQNRTFLASEVWTMQACNWCSIDLFKISQIFSDCADGTVLKNLLIKCFVRPVQFFQYDGCWEQPCSPHVIFSIFTGTEMLRTTHLHFAIGQVIQVKFFEWRAFYQEYRSTSRGGTADVSKARQMYMKRLLTDNGVFPCAAKKDSLKQCWMCLLVWICTFCDLLCRYLIDCRSGAHGISKSELPLPYEGMRVPLKHSTTTRSWVHQLH